jgi:hypothetical protein
LGGKVVKPMKRLPGRRRRFGHYWQAIGENSAVRWTTYVQDDGEQFISGPTGYIVLGPVRFYDLRSVPLSTMQPHRPGFPEFHQAEPPTRRQIESAWKRSADARATDQVKVQGPRTFAKRADEESTDLFYRRVAQFYREAVLDTGTPAKDLAEAAQVPLSTSKWWIREARAREFLPPTTQGKGIA